MSSFLNKVRFYSIVVVFSISITSLYAQEKYAKDYEQQGDIAMKEGDYSKGYEYYLLGRKFIKQSANLTYKCAEACLKLKDYDKAEYWYQKVLIEYDTLNINSSFPYLYLHLAQASISNGNIIQAQSFLNTCLIDCDNVQIRQQCNEMLSQIDWIIENDKQQNYLITNLGDGINTPTSQMGTYVLRDSLLLYSTPEFKTKTNKGVTYYKDIHNQIYYSFIDKDYYTRGKKLSWGKINNKKKDVADLFLDTNDMTSYFTYAKIRNGEKVTSIYYSQFNTKKNKWSKPKIYKPLNDKYHSYSHPVIAYKGDEKLMYFASNRDGGEGGMDIWYIDMNDKYAKPINLGKKVNTKGDEITPFYHAKNGELYFSSDTHKGFGGFDIFKSKGWKLDFQMPQNLMKPINSSANDTYPFITDCDCIGYFTSNRPNSSNANNKTCCNDLYRFDKYAPSPYEEIPTYNVTPTPVPITTTNREKFTTDKDLPITLYFHNDSPDPDSKDSTTNLSYEDCYKEYLSLTNTYKAFRTKSLDDSVADFRLKEIDDFINGKLKYGFSALNTALDYMIEKLFNGAYITIEIKGFSSSLFDTDYNRILAKRRIQSVINYVRSYRGGAFQAYMDNKAQDGKAMFEIKEMAIGKLQSTSPNPTNIKEKRESIYLPQSMKERRIEIQSINIRNNQ